VASKQDHGPAQHDYPAWQKKWHALLTQSSRVIVEDAWLWPAPEQFEHADVLVFYYWNRDWNAEKMGQLDEFLARGKGVVVLHSATIGNPMVEQLAERIGLASDSVKTKYLHTPIDLNIVATNSPIMRGLPSQIHFIDEPYWPMIGDTNRVEVLATAAQDGADWPIMWTFQKDKGRVFASIFGHYTWTWEDPVYQIIVLRGIAWAAGEDPASLESLATTSLETQSNVRKN
jgi:type 1 glutamine amidotransferase